MTYLPNEFPIIKWVLINLFPLVKMEVVVESFSGLLPLLRMESSQQGSLAFDKFVYLVRVRSSESFP